MKFQYIKDVSRLFSVVDQCRGAVLLVTEEGDRLNLKSKLCQYVSFGRMFSDEAGAPVEIIASNEDDEARLKKFKEEECDIEQNK